MLGRGRPSTGTPSGRRMSHKHLCDVAVHWFECDGKALRRGDSEPSVCRCDTCGLPWEESDHNQCQSPIELVTCPEHRDVGRRSIVATEMKQAAACQEAAYEQVMKTPDGTPEYYQALEGFFSLLFPHCNPTTPERMGPPLMNS